MLLGVPVSEVIAIYGDGGMSNIEIHLALKQCRFVWNALVYPDLLWAGYYLVSTPSLNIPGGMHCVILESEEGDGIPKVYDPNNGKDGKRFYEKGTNDVRSWSEVIYIYRGGKLPARVA